MSAWRGRVQGFEGSRKLLLAGDSGFIDRENSDAIKKNIAEIDRMLKALIKSLENKPSNP
jgi:hypothetical protein